MEREHIFYSSPFCSAFKSDRYGASNKLLYEWQLKEKEIQDKAKYCNAVWVPVGKAAMEN